TGVTSDINNRIFLHYEGKGALMTKLNKPKALLAYKPFSSKSDALSMEQQVKKMPKIGKLLLVKEWNKNSSNFVDVN
ncbi:MAG: GIY-YIG nuclease family protein, partial [Acinetobacter sp.]|nr:GIY-YIG nuclease family protein [Acinetobacter sp.]